LKNVPWTLIWLSAALLPAAAGVYSNLLSAHPRPWALILLALVFADLLIAWGMQKTRLRDIAKGLAAGRGQFDGR
jgi:hypothetical protein